MKEITVFLGSSIVEFEREREQIANFVWQLGRRLRDSGVNVVPFLCEHESHQVTGGRKQDEYNDRARDSRYAYFLVGRRAGEFTVEEFRAAYEAFLQTNDHPRSHTFFLELPDGEEPDRSTRELMRCVDEEVCHYHDTFPSVDTVKLDLLLELIRDPDVGGTVAFEKGAVTLNGVGVASLENIPLYRNNDALSRARAELDECNARFVRSRAALSDRSGRVHGVQGCLWRGGAPGNRA